MLTLKTGLPLAFALGLVVALAASKVLKRDIPSGDDPVQVPASRADAEVMQALDTTVSSAIKNSTIDETLPIRWQNEIEYLHQELETAREEREELMAELNSLSRQVGELAQTAEGSRTLAVDPESSQLIPGTPEFNAARDSAHRRSFGESNPRESRDSLVAAGVDEQTADDIQRRVDEFALSRLELIDQASREGWRDSAQFSERLEELETNRVNLRDELGEAAYDRYLFEQGRNNRVGISSVISGSAADIAGILTGDLLISYADTRIFTSDELQSATRSGARGEYVQITARRGQEILAVEVPRGPLGVTLIGIRSQP